MAMGGIDLRGRPSPTAAAENVQIDAKIAADRLRLIADDLSKFADSFDKLHGEIAAQVARMRLGRRNASKGR